MSKKNMNLIMEGWRQSIKEMNAAAVGGVQGHAGADEQVEEGFVKEEKATAHNIVRRMEEKDPVVIAIMSFGVAEQDAEKWFEENAQDINRAKRELGLRESAI